ncbi:chromosome condensation protein CrcB [Hypericibacter terrae]|uniref:Chromosome condensation protein CrcB n=1 Tax=Hypericibacter terrae TaxID=2602015 RepID=A0A5J6MNU7_9PROT|nr:DUF302 domain-containing protein [Hypericibacter terrae]QEX16436.1 chromosome condensation protein CrcB [Hypericibacter terrae]
MFTRPIGYLSAAILAFGLLGCAAQPMSQAADGPAAAANGIVVAKSGYAMSETLSRLKQDIAAKGLMFFQEVDQSKLATAAGVDLRPSTLLEFGNPALGGQFMTANPQAGIDWPVRLLVFEDPNGQVWVEYTDFAYIAKRHAVTDRDPQFKMASDVIASIASSVTTP